MPTVLGHELTDRQVAIGAAVLSTPLLYRAAKYLRGAPSVKKNGPYKGVPLPEGAFEVLVVGAGPSGSTLGYYYAKARRQSRCGCVQLRRRRPAGPGLPRARLAALSVGRLNF
jgi:hypothetical protein